MKNFIAATAMLLIFSAGASAQTKEKVTARPSEQREIAADNHLKRSIQQKQLLLPAEKIADTINQSANKGERKKRKCGTKVPKKA